MEYEKLRTRQSGQFHWRVTSCARWRHAPALGPKPEVGAADLGLIRRCLAGDTQAWADVYLRYRTPLYALSLSWTRNHALAEDVVHDAFVRAFEQMKTFDQQGRVFPWLAAIRVSSLINT